MVETINPAVCGTRKRYVTSLATYFVGVTGGAGAVVILAVSLLAVAGGVPWVALVATVCAIGMVVARDVGVAVPVPYRRRQVPEWLRGVVPLPVTAMVFGFELGIGFLTHFTTSAHLTVMALAGWTALSSPRAAALIVVAYAVGKTLPLALTPRSLTQEEIEEVIEWNPRAIRLMRMGTAATSAIVAAQFFNQPGWLY